MRHAAKLALLLLLTSPVGAQRKDCHCCRSDDQCTCEEGKCACHAPDAAAPPTPTEFICTATTGDERTVYSAKDHKLVSHTITVTATVPNRLLYKKEVDIKARAKALKQATDACVSWESEQLKKADQK